MLANRATRTGSLSAEEERRAFKYWICKLKLGVVFRWSPFHFLLRLSYRVMVDGKIRNGHNLRFTKRRVSMGGSVCVCGGGGDSRTHTHVFSLEEPVIRYSFKDASADRALLKAPISVTTLPCPNSFRKHIIFTVTLQRGIGPLPGCRGSPGRTEHANSSSRKDRGIASLPLLCER